MCHHIYVLWIYVVRAIAMNTVVVAVSSTIVWRAFEEQCMYMQLDIVAESANFRRVIDLLLR